MKTAYVITRFSGGAKNYLVDLLREKDCSIICGPESNFDELRKLERNGVNVYVDKFLVHKNPFKLLISLFTTHLIFRREKFNLVHTNSTEAGVVGRISAKLAGSKVVHTVHAVPFEKRWYNGFLIAMEIIAGLFCDRIIFISNKLIKEFHRYGIGKNKRIVIPLGIDLKKFDVKRTQNKFKVLTVSRLVEAKGLERIIGLAKELPDVTFEIAGDGPLKSKLRMKSRNLKNFKLLGMRKDVPKLMKNSSVFLLLSEREGTPLVIYEAMAAGLPVVSTDVGGIRDQIQNNKTGFIVETDEQAKDKILQLQDSKLWTKMSKSSVARSKNFDINDMKRKTYKLYKEVMRYK